MHDGYFPGPCDRSPRLTGLAVALPAPPRRIHPLNLAKAEHLQCAIITANRRVHFVMNCHTASNSSRFLHSFCSLLLHMLGLDDSVCHFPDLVASRPVFHSLPAISICSSRAESASRFETT